MTSKIDEVKLNIAKKFLKQMFPNKYDRKFIPELKVEFRQFNKDKKTTWKMVESLLSNKEHYWKSRGRPRKDYWKIITDKDYWRFGEIQIRGGGTKRMY